MPRIYGSGDRLHPEDGRFYDGPDEGVGATLDDLIGRNDSVEAEMREIDAKAREAGEDEEFLLGSHQEGDLADALYFASGAFPQLGAYTLLIHNAAAARAEFEAAEARIIEALNHTARALVTRIEGIVDGDGGTSITLGSTDADGEGTGGERDSDSTTAEHEPEPESAESDPFDPDLGILIFRPDGTTYYTTLGEWWGGGAEGRELPTGEGGDRGGG